MKELKENKYEEITGLSEFDLEEKIIIEENENQHEDDNVERKPEEVNFDDDIEGKFIVDDFEDDTELKSTSLSAIKPQTERKQISRIKSLEIANTESDEDLEKETVEEREQTSEASITFTIPDELKDKLSGNVDFDVIGSIDLKEAEIIANEDLLFLTEDDLIEGIEEFELIPLETEQKIANSDELPQETEPSEEFIEPLPPQKLDKETDTLSQDVSEPVKTEITEEPVSDNFEIQAEEKSTTDQSAVSEEIEIESQEESSDLILTEIKPDVSPNIATDEIAEKIIIQEETDQAEDEESFHEFIQDESEHEMAVQIQTEEKIDTNEKQTYPLRRKPGYRPEKEKLADNLAAIDLNEKNVLFSDDIIVEKPEIEKFEIFEENELERITSGINEIAEGHVVVLAEAEEEEDKELIANILQGSSSSFEDLILDFEDIEYKYQDEEIDFINSAIIEEDYSRYIREIDEYYGTEAGTSSSITIELFGLSSFEISFVEESLFESEYKDIDLDEMYELISIDFSRKKQIPGAEYNYNYILSTPESLTKNEKISIEVDISSPSALIFEEDVERIKQLLGRPVKDIKELVEDRIEPKKEITPVLETNESEVIIPPENQYIETEEEKFETIESEEIIDITDEIIIIEDELDVDRFIRKFPEKKQDDLRVLLEYLDGLFEKLPESTIRNFANSEYFDLYVKVLNDVGI